MLVSGPGECLTGTKRIGHFSQNSLEDLVSDLVSHDFH